MSGLPREVYLRNYLEPPTIYPSNAYEERRTYPDGIVVIDDALTGEVITFLPDGTHRENSKSGSQTYVPKNKHRTETEHEPYEFRGDPGLVIIVDGIKRLWLSERQEATAYDFVAARELTDEEKAFRLRQVCF
jgi:hypothetical protein